jgi:outer membrane protein
MKIFILITLSIFLLSAPMSSHAAGVEVAVGGWYQSPRGDLSYEKLGSGDILDLEDDLNYDDQFSLSGRLKIDTPFFLPNIYVMATQMEWDETGQKTVNFNFGGNVFAGNQEFDSELHLNHLDIALFYGISPLEKATLGIFNIDIGINIKIVDFKAKIKQDATGTKESESLVIPVPTAYIGAQIRPWSKVSIEFEGRGVTFSGDTYIGLIGRLKVRPLGPVFIAGGYRYEDVDFKEEGFDVDVSFSGPFAEIGLKF